MFPKDPVQGFENHPVGLLGTYYWAFWEQSAGPFGNTLYKNFILGGPFGNNLLGLLGTIGGPFGNITLLKNRALGGPFGNNGWAFWD